MPSNVLIEYDTTDLAITAKHSTKMLRADFIKK